MYLVKVAEFNYYKLLSIITEGSIYVQLPIA